MEKAFIGTEPQNTREFQEVSDKSKRSALVFITAESDSTSLVLEDLKKFMKFQKCI